LDWSMDSNLAAIIARELLYAICNKQHDNRTKHL
jgi:hypothetical protein